MSGATHISFASNSPETEQTPKALAAIIMEAAGDSEPLHIRVRSSRNIDTPSAEAKAQFSAAFSGHDKFQVRQQRHGDSPIAEPMDLNVSFTERDGEIVFTANSTQEGQTPLNRALNTLNTRDVAAVTRAFSDNNPTFSL